MLTCHQEKQQHLSAQWLWVIFGGSDPLGGVPPHWARGACCKGIPSSSGLSQNCSPTERHTETSDGGEPDTKVKIFIRFMNLIR